MPQERKSQDGWGSPTANLFTAVEEVEEEGDLMEEQVSVRKGPV